MRLASDSSESLISIYSIASSASASNVGGTSMPKARAILVDDELKGDRLQQGVELDIAVFNPTEFGQAFAQGCLLTLIDGICFLED
jgi:hypothetical protein